MSAETQLFGTPDPMDAPNHVRPVEGRCEVCGMGADRCDGVPAEVMERMRRFIDVYGSFEGWKFAKTMADIPHSYAVRAKAARLPMVRDGGPRGPDDFSDVNGEDEFVWFAKAIRVYGYKRAWKPGAKRLQYVNVDGWRYWTMGNPIPETTILNRALITREGREQLRCENGLTNVRWYACHAQHRFGIVVESLARPDRLNRPDELHLVLDCPVCGKVGVSEVDGP